MFFILLGLIVAIGMFIFGINKKGFDWGLLIMCILLFIVFIPLGTICDMGHEEFVKAEEYNLYLYEDNETYLKIGDHYYFCNIIQSEKENIKYEAIDEIMILKKETRVYELNNINNPIIEKYTAKPKKNFFTFGLREHTQMYKVFIPKGTISINK